MSRISSRNKILLTLATLILGINSIWAIKAMNVDSATEVAGNSIDFGIADANLISEAAQKQAGQLRAMKSIGIKAVRVDANWRSVEPTPSTFYWTRLDQVVRSIRAVGMAVDLIIDGCPPWAALPGYAADPFAQPSSTAQYAQWAARVAVRYAPAGVRYFEVWNEQNISRFWQPKPNPAAYTADLRAAYAAIKKIDRSAIIISGGLSPAADDGIDYSPIAFLKEMYAHGAKGSFDALGFHPYTFPLAPDNYNPGSAWSQMDETSPSLRSVMTRAGDASKRIWITEYGAPTTGPWRVSAVAQLAEITQALAYAKKHSWIGAFYIYTWRDIASLAAKDEGFGLKNVNGTPKPAFSAVASNLTH